MPRRMPGVTQSGGCSQAARQAGIIADNCNRNHYLNSKAGIAEFADAEE